MFQSSFRSLRVQAVDVDAWYCVQEELDFWANPVFENALDEETADGFVDGFNLVLDMASS